MVTINPTVPDMSGMSSSMGNMGDMKSGSAAISVDPGSIWLYLPIWIAMMVAMMFPAAAPVVALFATISQNRRAANQRAAPTWIFVAGYLAVWRLLGVAAYLPSRGFPSISLMASRLPRAY